jgi:hypothetical protein
MCGSLEAPQKRVMIDIYHSLEVVDPEVNMMAISKLLPEFSFESRNEELTEDLLEEYNVVMLYQPYKVLESSEIDAVVEFVRKGGGLIICGEHDIGWNDDSRSTYNKLGKTFGIIFTSNAVDDPTDKMGCYCTPVIHNLAEHPLTENVTQVVFYKPCALRLSGNAVAIARGDEDSKTVGDDKIEGEDIVVVAVAEYERGRIVVVGSYTVFDDSYINSPDNMTFSENVFPWVSEQAFFEPQESGTLMDSLEGNMPIIVAILVIVSVLVAAIALQKRQQKQRQKQKEEQVQKEEQDQEQE